MKIEICIGSSCTIRGSHQIVELFKRAISKYDLDDKVTLSGAFCIGKCCETGVTVQIDGNIFIGVNEEGFDEFFKKNVLDKIKD